MTGASTDEAGNGALTEDRGDDEQQHTLPTLLSPILSGATFKNRRDVAQQHRATRTTPVQEACADGRMQYAVRNVEHSDLFAPARPSSTK